MCVFGERRETPSPIPMLPAAVGIFGPDVLQGRASQSFVACRFGSVSQTAVSNATFIGGDANF